jgi:putative ABC transport system ATP-binding protein
MNSHQHPGTTLQDPRAGQAATAASPQTHSVVLESVTKTFGEGDLAVHALRGVDLTLAPGEFVVVLGPSGSGKTTLLNLTGGIETLTSGRLTVAGRDVGTLGRDERTAFRRDVVGFVFQFFNLIPSLTALENVDLVLELTGHAEDGRAEAHLREVGLTDRLGHFPAQLSGGEQQRVAIARALAKRPPVLLCDEPTGALDVDTARVVLALLRRLQQEHGTTVLLVTHNSAIAPMADRVLRLRSGAIVDDIRNARPVGAEELDW